MQQSGDGYILCKDEHGTVVVVSAFTPPHSPMAHTFQSRDPADSWSVTADVSSACSTTAGLKLLKPGVLVFGHVPNSTTKNVPIHIQLSNDRKRRRRDLDPTNHPCVHPYEAFPDVLYCTEGGGVAERYVYPGTHGSSTALWGSIKSPKPHVDICTDVLATEWAPLCCTKQGAPLFGVWEGGAECDTHHVGIRVVGRCAVRLVDVNYLSHPLQAGDHIGFDRVAGKVGVWTHAPGQVMIGKVLTPPMADRGHANEWMVDVCLDLKSAVAPVVPQTTSSERFVTALAGAVDRPTLADELGSRLDGQTSGIPAHELQQYTDAVASRDDSVLEYVVAVVDAMCVGFDIETLTAAVTTLFPLVSVAVPPDEALGSVLQLPMGWQCANQQTVDTLHEYDAILYAVLALRKWLTGR